MASSWRPTLRQLFAVSLVGLLLGLGLLFYLVFNGSERAILQSSERYRQLASRIVANRVNQYLQQAPAALADFENQIRHGLVDPMNTDSAEKGLLSLLLANPNISEATFTYADSRAYGPGHHAKADPKLTGQVTVLLAAPGDGFVRKQTWYDGTRFISRSEPLSLLSPVASATRAVPVPDPTDHATFQGAVDKDLYGQIISTDLHWAQIDEALPPAQRRVELSVQKSIENPPGHFAGVLRIGLMKTQIDGAVNLHIAGPGEADPHIIFLCDNGGRVITTLAGKGHVTVSDDDLRIAAEDVPPVVARALRDSKLKAVGDTTESAAISFTFEGKVYLASFNSLAGTQGWIVGIVVPRDYYTGSLVKIRNEVGWTLLGLTLVLVAAGLLVLRSVARAQALIRRETARMNDFEFAPSQNTSYFRDIQEVLGGLERAKTAMRSMSKYVPIDLVRRLYCSSSEPMLGGVACDLSVLFTDIKDFTSISEKLQADELAEILGQYLQVMAGIIQGEKGTIDKFIGDAVMAFWNAPEKIAGHEILACRAAVRCRDALEKTRVAPRPKNVPGFETRFGLHRCVASVGHFGAPDRFNFTAIGDGVNLASRLEGLNKFYGTTIIASETIYAAAKEQFDFRLLDRVAVKGKTMGITIYELLGERKPGVPQPGHVDCYEQAFALYQQGNFAAALDLVATQADDAPSQLLAQRCRDLIANPPRDWTGIHGFDSK